MIKAVCFDLDGTLFDDRQYVRAGLEQSARALEDRTGRNLTEALLEAYFRRGRREKTFDVVLSEAGLSADLVPVLVEAYHDNDAPLVPYDDAVETLETLADSYALGLITGGTNGYAKLARLGLAEFFDEVIVTAETETTKRDPAPFEEMAARFDVSYGSMIYVGDRPSLDFPQPNQLGIGTIRLRRGYYADAEATGTEVPDVTVETLQEVPRVIEDHYC